MKSLYPFSFCALLLAAPLNAQTVRGPGAGPALPVVTAPGTVWHPSPPETPGRGGAPVNDDCSTVPDMVLPLGGSLTFTGDNTGATATNDYEPGSVLEGVGPCVWHKFTTAGCANIVVSYCATTPAFPGVVAFMSATCPTGSDYLQFYSYNYTECGNGNGTVYYMAVPAGTWYLPVMMNTGNGSVGPYSILVTAEACPEPPANDDCAGAVAVVPQATCNFTTFTSNGATESMPAAECGLDIGFANDDVWFSFTATLSTMTIRAKGADEGGPNTGFNAVLELFSGTCGNLVSIACEDDSIYSQAEQITASGLTVGQTYYVRVYDWSPGYPPVPDFGFCVVEGDGSQVGIAERGLDRAWSVWPSPGNGLLQLQWNGQAAPATVEVLDPTGRSVRTVRLQLAQGQSRELDLRGLAAGNYVVALTVRGVRSMQRVVVN